MRSRAQLTAAVAALALLATVVTTAPYAAEAQAAALDTTAAVAESAAEAADDSAIDDGDTARTVVDAEESLGFATTVAQQDEPEQSTDTPAAAVPDAGSDDETEAATSVPAIDPSIPTADLTLSVTTSTETLLAEGFVEYAVTVTNAGPAEAENVVVTSELPDFLSFIAMTGCWLANDTFPECHLNEIPAGASRTFDIIAMTSPGSAGPVTFSASVTSETVDADPTNNTASLESEIFSRATWYDISGSADLSIVAIDLDDSVSEPGTIGYTILVANAGTRAATEVVVTNVLPDGVTVESAPGCTQAGNELTCTLGTIEPGAMASLTIVVSADPGTTGDITTTATVTSQGMDTNGANNSTSETITVNTAPVAVDDAATVAETAGATIVAVLSNDTDVDADALTVTAVDAAGTTGVVALTNGVVTYDPNGQFDSLAVGETATDTFTYDISDGNGGTATGTVTVTVDGVNEAPVAVADTATVGEDDAATTVDLTTNDTDANSDTLTVTAVATTATTGMVMLNAGVVTYDPNGQFESLSDGETAIDTFTYDISDGNGGTATATVVVTINGVNDAPEIISDGGGATAAATVDENLTAVTDVDSTDADGDTESGGLAYALSGADQALFGIDAVGALAFITAPDFETPADVGGDNVYDVIVTVTDAGGFTDTQAIAITVADVNEAPSISAPFAAQTLGEVTVDPFLMLTSTDPEGETDNGGGLTYSLAGPDAGIFAFDADTGAVSLPVALDFENPADVGGDNVYNVTFVVTDSGALTGTQDFTLTIVNTNEMPMLNLAGTATLGENITVVVDVESTDPDGETESGGGLLYTLGGPDVALFSIDAAGNLAFIAAPDFETPQDADTNNVYELEVTVTDAGNLVDTQAITITVEDVNERPILVAVDETSEPETFSGPFSFPVAAVSDPDDGDTATFSLSGADATPFAIDATTGEMSLTAPLNFENPADEDGDNEYELTIVVTDALGLTDSRVLLYRVTNVNEAPTITAVATATVPENTTAVLTATSSDPDNADTAAFSVSGPDATEFSIDPGTGVLTFDPAPDFETPGDAGSDNVYNVTVIVTDGGNLTATQAVAITVTNVNEAPTFTNVPTLNIAIQETISGVLPVTIAAIDPDGETGNGGGLTYSLSGPDADSFAIDADTGAWSMPAPLDFENPSDANNDGVYEMTFVVTDAAGLTDTSDHLITSSNVNEAPTITAADTATVAENTTAVVDVDATDPDGQTENGGGLSYSLGGTDGALFSIDAAGALAFSTAPDFEAPGDAGGDNVYNVTVTVTDGTLTDSQAIAVTVEDQADPPTITSDGGGDTAAISAGENLTAVTDVDATDPEAGALAFTLSGPDQGQFTLAIDGVLTFTNPPDFEAPGDAGGDNVYNVTVTVTDDDTLTDTQDLAITVTNVNEAPTVSAPATVSVDEGTTATVLTATSSDPDVGDALTYSTGGTDGAAFDIDASGNLTFLSTPDFEIKSSYSLTITVTDDGVGALSATTSVIMVSINDQPDPPVITSNGGGDTAAINSAENQTAVTDVDATDQDGGSPTFAFGGGADDGLFAIDGTSGVLTWIAAPDFETAADAGADNVYNVTVTATDAGNLVDTQTIAVTITNVNEAPTVSASGVTVPENTTATVLTATGSDPDVGDTLTYSTGGTDGTAFNIDASGNLTFVTAPDFETKSSYSLTITVTDDGVGALSATTSAITVTVDNVNEAPEITSDGGGDTAAVTAAQGSTAVTTVAATDPEGTTPTYSLSGADSAQFAISPAGVLTFNVAPAAAATLTITVTASDGVLDDTQDITITVPPNTAPTAVDDVYSNLAVNVRLDAGTGTAGIDVDDADGVLTKGADDSDPEANPLSVTQVNGTAITSGSAITLPSGGTLTMFTNGTFTYVSEPGETAASDSFTYTVSDGSLTDTATVTINFGTDTIWFIDGGFAGTGNGTSAAPFTTVGAFNAATTETGDIIHLATGTYTVAGFTLLNDQKLFGAGVALTSGALTIPAGTRPTLSPGTGNGVNLAANNTVSGLDIGNTPAGYGLSGTNVGSPTINTMSITGTGGIMTINGGNLSAVTLGNSSSTSAAASGISLQNLTSTFSPGGSISITNSAAAAVSLLNNANITFGGGLTVDNTTSNQPALVGSGGGALSIPAGTNTLNAGSATAADINGMSLGVVLTRVDSVGGTAPGVKLVNTTGFFTVTGSSNGCSSGPAGASCSGGLISNKSGNGIELTNVTNITLNDMNIRNSGGNGIVGTGVSGFTIDDSRVTGNGDSAGEDGMRFSELTGTVTMSNLNVAGSFSNEVSVNNTTGILTALNVTNSTFGPNANGDNGLQVLSTGGATVNMNVNGSTFDSVENIMLLVELAGSGGGAVNIGTTTGNTFTANRSGIQHAVKVVAGGANNTVSANVSNNTAVAGTATFDSDVFVFSTEPVDANTPYSGTFNITLDNNEIGRDGVNGSVVSAATQGDSAISINHETGTFNTLVNNNRIYDFSLAGVEVFYGANNGTSGTMNATITNNTIRDAAGARGAIEFIGDEVNTCQHVSGNTLDNLTGSEILIDTFATAPRTHAIVGLTTLTAPGIATLWAANNGNLPTGAGGVQVFQIDAIITSVASCPQPA